MNYISAEEINKTAPYQVTQVDSLSVRFSTRYGVHYWVGFMADIFIVTENGYYLYLVDESGDGAYDPFVFQTVLAVIENFFAHTIRDVMLYICSPSDGRQASRARLFQKWFDSAGVQDKYSLVTYHNNDDVREYFYGIILRKDNPEHDKLVKIFIEFLSDN